MRILWRSSILQVSANSPGPRCSQQAFLWVGFRGATGPIDAISFSCLA